MYNFLHFVKFDARCHRNFMKPILKHMVLSPSEYKEQFVYPKICTENEIKFYDEFFLMNSQNFLRKCPECSAANKKSLMSLIPSTSGDTRLYYSNNINSLYSLNRSYIIVCSCI